MKIKHGLCFLEDGVTTERLNVSFMHFPEFSCAGEKTRVRTKRMKEDEFVPLGRDEEGGAERRGDNPRNRQNEAVRLYWNCEVSQIQRRAEGCPDQQMHSGSN